jgi:hypothetical protein
MYYLNQDAHLEIQIFTLAGRLVHTISEQLHQGGQLHEITMSVRNMGSDIYIFKVSARTDDNQRASVMKKFGVIR